jgi:DNA-binding response OmpR family regulator
MVEGGTEAFKAAVTDKPAVMIVSVHLAGLSGVAICEGVKGSPHLKMIRVALVGSELSADLFNRDTALAYGADLFLEEGMEEIDLRDGLAALLGAASGAPVEVDDPITSLATGADSPGTAAEEIARLARIMLADLRLYNPDRFTEALRSGRLLESFKDELARGRDLVDHRFPEVSSRQELLAAALAERARQELVTPS